MSGRRHGRGMTAIGFVGGSHASAQLGEQLTRAGARAIVADLRHLKGTVGRDPRLVATSTRAALLRPRCQLPCALGRLLLVLVADLVETDINDIRPEFRLGSGKLSPSSTSTNCICV